MRHNRFDEVSILVRAGIPVLLEGEKGSGKTTLIAQVAKELELEFYTISMTRQTTLSHLLGFVSVNGTYISTHLRQAAEFGGVFNIDEIDAGDSNVLLTLNTIENGYLTFPDKIVYLHKDFRLVATANPHDQHENYVGRNKLDAATLDRFDIVDMDRDEELEKSLVDTDVFRHITIARKILANENSSTVLSMRDTLRYQKRKDLGLLENFIFRLLGKSTRNYGNYLTAIESVPKYTLQEDCETVDELFTLITAEADYDTAIPY